MSGYGSDSSNPSYIESVASLKRKTKEDLRLDQIIPEEILTDSGETGIKQLLEKYYEFMNMNEFIYDETTVFTDTIASGRAVFRIPDPNNDNNKFFADFDGANSTLVIDNGPLADPATTTISLSASNVAISNGNELPGSLADLQTAVGKTFTVNNISSSHNGKTATLTTPEKNYVGPGPSYIINAIEDALNIDSATDDYLEILQKEIAAAIPRNLTVDKKNLYKNIADFYKVKGTSDSIEIFFRLLFNESVEVDFPFDSTLIPSSGNWDTGLQQYLDKKGFLSDTIKLQDSRFFQKFSYVVRTGKNLSDWGPSFDRLVHPAGFIFFGEILLLTQLTRAALGDNIRQSAQEVDLGFSEGQTGQIPVPNAPGFVYTYKDIYGRENRKTLSSMPGLQPGVIGIEDVALLVEAFASAFLPGFEAKIHLNGQLSANINALTDGGNVTSVSIVNPGFGYTFNLATETIVNGQKTYDGPSITISGDGSNATATCRVDEDGRIDSVTVTQAGSNYTSAGASVTGNPNAGKLSKVKLFGPVNDKEFLATAFGITRGSDGLIEEQNTNIAPTVVFDAPTSTDADGNLLASNVTATGNINLDSDGQITGFTITNVGNGYVTDPIMRINSQTSGEIRAKDVPEISIVALNHVATEVLSSTFRTLVANNYFNLKKESYYANKKFRFGEQISFFSDHIIQNSYSNVINKYNTNAIIHQE